jgi:hypothetical protein
MSTMVPGPFSECGLDCQVFNSVTADQSTTLPNYTILPLVIGNGDDQVRLRETDDFRRACVVTGCDTRSMEVAKNHLTCQPAGLLQGSRKVHWHLPFGTLFKRRW